MYNSTLVENVYKFMHWSDNRQFWTIDVRKIHVRKIDVVPLIFWVTWWMFGAMIRSHCQSLFLYVFLRFPVGVPRLNCRAGKDEKDCVQSKVDCRGQVKNNWPSLNSLLKYNTRLVKISFKDWPKLLKSMIN